MQTLISSMMSSQTTDLVNEGAMRRLYEACGITIEGLEAMGEEGIIAAIQPVSFYTAKAQNILKVCRILREQYDGDVPRTFEELLELPGIGPKMVRRVVKEGWLLWGFICLVPRSPRTTHTRAHTIQMTDGQATLIMAYGWGEVVGICVDTHVHRSVPLFWRCISRPIPRPAAAFDPPPQYLHTHRISNRLGWADTWNHKNSKAQNPEKTRKLLESWMPREHWWVVVVVVV